MAESESECDGRVRVRFRWPSPSAIAESEWAFPGSLFPSPIEMAEWHGRVIFWPIPWMLRQSELRSSDSRIFRPSPPVCCGQEFRLPTSLVGRNMVSTMTLLLGFVCPRSVILDSGGYDVILWVCMLSIYYYVFLEIALKRNFFLKIYIINIYVYTIRYGMILYI